MIEFIHATIAPMWTDRPADPFAAGRLNRLLDRKPSESTWELVKQGLRIHAVADVVVFCAGTVFPTVTRVMAGETVALTPTGPGFRDYLVAVPMREAGTRRWIAPDEWGYTTELRVRAGGVRSMRTGAWTADSGSWPRTAWASVWNGSGRRYRLCRRS